MLRSLLTSYNSRKHVPSIGNLIRQNPELYQSRDEYNFHVTATNLGQRKDTQEALQYFVEHSGSYKPAHLYFHVPLCNYICSFCNFVRKKARTDQNELEEELENWTDVLIAESNNMLQVAPWLRKAKIESFFVGGGTATILGDKQLKRLVDHVDANYSVESDAERTLEGNPDHLMLPEKIEQALDLGFTRFSVGVQSLEDKVTDFVSRGHNREMTLKAIALLKQTKKPFNVDLIYGLPLQTPESFATDVRQLVEMGVPTITMYRLRNNDRKQLHIGTRSAWNHNETKKKIEAQGLFPSIEQTQNMRELSTKVLMDAKYSPSPSCFWSAPDTYPWGNMPRSYVNKWLDYDSHIAYGPGVYGWLSNGKEKGQVLQYHNTLKIHDYEKAVKSGQSAIAHGYLLNGHVAVASALAFSFKSCQPILYSVYKNRYGVDISTEEPIASVLRLLVQKNLMEELPGGSGLLTTLEGELLHEEVVAVYFHGILGKSVVNSKNIEKQI
jgi:coproporphyrinogen III oxidase-like Fe-S oxidoreductase